jgi:hypothetical protein
MMCIFGCALLALRAPGLAALLNLVALLYVLANHLLTLEGSWFAMALAGVLLVSSLATAERAFAIARGSSSKSTTNH